MLLLDTLLTPFFADCESTPSERRESSACESISRVPSITHKTIMRAVFLLLCIVGSMGLRKPFGGKKDCDFVCRNPAHEALPRPGHRPSANGCGTQGMNIDVSHFPGMERCCNEHDRCYDLCGKTRIECDAAFAKCLKKVCKSDHNCGNQASLLSMGVEMFGCPAYQKSQEKACICQPRKRIEHDEL